MMHMLFIVVKRNSEPHSPASGVMKKAIRTRTQCSCTRPANILGSMLYAGNCLSILSHFSLPATSQRSQCRLTFTATWFVFPNFRWPKFGSSVASETRIISTHVQKCIEDQAEPAEAAAIGSDVLVCFWGSFWGSFYLCCTLEISNFGRS